MTSPRRDEAKDVREEIEALERLSRASMPRGLDQLDAAISAWAGLALRLAEQVERLEAERCVHGWRGSPPKDGKHIVTPCPSCGTQSLFIGAGGHLTCARVPVHGGSDGCKNPSLQNQIETLTKQRDEARRERDEAQRCKDCKCECHTEDI